MRQEVVEGCSQLQAPGPGQERMSAVSAKPAWCPVCTGTRNWWPKFAPPPVPRKQPREPLSPLSLQGGARTTRVRFCGGQTERTLRGKDNPHPNFQRAGTAGRINTLMQAAQTGPTAHTAGTQKPRPAPSAEKTTLCTQTALTAAAGAAASQGLAWGCHLLVLFPAGSMRRQRHKGSAGLSDTEFWELSPGPTNI